MIVSSTPSPRSQRLQADLTLLLVALIWGIAFVAQRVAALSMSTYIFNGARFMLAVLVLLPFVWQGRASLRNWGWRHVGGVSLAGVLMFAGATLQQEGLRFTTATNAGFITGLYVVFIPLLLAFVWRQPPPRLTWAAALVAISGLYLLSTGGSIHFALGDLLELICALMWALHVIVIGRLVNLTGALNLVVGQNIVCGMLSLALGAVVDPDAWQAIPAAWLPVLYTGVFSVGIGYTLQAYAQRTAPASDAAIILSLEAVFAALGGWLLLSERLAPLQLFGCGLMLAGMLLVQLKAYTQIK